MHELTKCKQKQSKSGSVYIYWPGFREYVCSSSRLWRGLAQLCYHDTLTLHQISPTNPARY